MNQGQTISYKAWVELDGFAEEMQVVFDGAGIRFDSLFSVRSCSYAEITEILFENYAVHVRGENLFAKCSRMGREGEWFYRELGEAYNRKVSQAFGVTASPGFETKGTYEYEGRNGKADIKVFEDGICILPANLEGRRIPFAFINGLQKEDYAVTLHLVTGEAYKFSMMGRNFELFLKKVTECIRAEKEKNRFLAKPVTEELRKRVLASKMKPYFQMLGSLGKQEKIYIAAKELKEEELQVLLSNMEHVEELSAEEREALRWRVWTVVPSADEKKAIVEFAFPEEATATYVFDVEEEWHTFVITLNRGLEAAGFGREAIYLSEEELKKKENGRMLVDRTPALQALRKKYLQRVIHNSPESWKKRIKEILEG